MEYVRIDENLPEHPKVLAMPRSDRLAAIGLHLRATCYCSRHLTDGHVPWGFLASDEEERLAGLLLDAGLFDKDASGFRVHDYLDYNRGKAEVEAYIDAKREAGRRGGLAKAAGKSVESSKSLAGASEVLDVCFKQNASKSYPEAEAEADTERERAARANLPACMTTDAWSVDGGDLLSSQGHILRAIESKHGLVAPVHLGMIGQAVTSRCPSDCAKKQPDVCAERVIAKVLKANNLRVACDWIRGD